MPLAHPTAHPIPRDRASPRRPPAVMWLVLLAVLLASAATAAYGSQTLLRTVTHAGYARQYRLFVPTSYTPAAGMPLVVNLHGGGSSGLAQITWSAMNVVAEREGFLVAYPDAVAGAWLGPDQTDPYDDFGFIDDVLAGVAATHAVQPGRVYATGLSAGGLMSYMLSVRRPYTFGAIASVAGVRPYDPGTTIYAPIGLPATPPRPFPLMHVHGTADVRIPYAGGENLGWVWPPCEQVVADYVLNNGCDPTPTLYDFPNLVTTDSSTVQRLNYGRGAAYVDVTGGVHEAEVLLYRVTGGGHSWPGGSGTWPDHCLPVNRDINASAEIWNFFSRHAVAIPEPAGAAVLFVAALGRFARRRH